VEVVFPGRSLYNKHRSIRQQVNGTIETDNNTATRVARGIAVGRKNWLEHC